MNKALLLLCLAGLGAACEPLPYSPNRSTEAPPPKMAFVHLVVASSPAQAVELHISHQVRAVVEKRGVSPRIELVAGDYPLELIGGGRTLHETGLHLLPGTETLLVAYAQPSPDDSGPLQQLSAYPLGQRDAKTARVRLLHAAIDAPPLALLAPTLSELVDGVASVAMSAYGTLPARLEPGASLHLRSPYEKAPLIDLSVPAGLAVGSATTLLGIGEIAPLSAPSDGFGVLSFDEESGALSELALSPSAQAPDGQILLFHASRDLAAVTPRSAGTALHPAIAYQRASTLAALPAGKRSLSLDEAAGPVWKGPLNLWPGRGWLLLLYGRRSAPKLVALPRPEQAPQTVWRVANLVDGLSSVDLLDGDDALVSGLSYGQASRPALVDALRPKTLRLRDRGMANRSWDIVVTSGSAAAALDQVVTVVLTGSASVPASVSAQLLIESRAGLSTAAPVLSLPTSPTL